MKIWELNVGRSISNGSLERAFLTKQILRKISIILFDLGESQKINTKIKK